MRSGSMAWLLHTAGYKTEILEGGYKAFRRWGSSLFGAHWNLRILTGYTGQWKTEVLQELKTLGAQVIDLEDLAAHRGSSFGGLGKGVQPSTEQFQNRLIEELTQMDPDLPLGWKMRASASGNVTCQTFLRSNERKSVGA